MLPNEDEHLIRIDNEEAAVQISTIHKSKGLEYDIVLLPELDFDNKSINKQRPSYTINKLNENGEANYVTVDTEDLTEAQIKEYLNQTEQENRRLIYVALTRAKYKIFIFSKTFKQKNASTLKTGLVDFINHLRNTTYNEALIAVDSTLELDSSKQYINPSGKEGKSITRHLSNLHFKNPNWQKISYSSIALHPEYPGYEKLQKYPSSYDAFVFKTLPLGAYTGTQLHTLFESIDFTNETFWKNAIHRIFLKKDSIDKELYQSQLIQLLKEVLNTKISVGNTQLSLSTITKQQRCNELEFYFPFQDFQYKSLQQINEPTIPWNVRHLDYSSIKGFMNGFIDLLFEYEGKYYILDWKSNFLGDQLDQYSTIATQDAMKNNNYHLQYMIYIIAVNKYLKSRMPSYNYNEHFGGVIYLFLRGVRSDSSSGIFTSKPSIHLIEKVSEILS